MRRSFEAGTAGAGGFSSGRMEGVRKGGVHDGGVCADGPDESFVGHGDSLVVLKRKLDELNRVKQELLDRCRRRVRVIDEQMDAVRRGLRSSEHRDTAAQDKNGGVPSVRLMAAPLVVQSEEGEYLGVQGGSGHFALRDFIDLMHRGAVAGKKIRLDWQRNRENWVLLVTAEDESNGALRRVVLVVRKFTTPAGNTVALIVRFTIDGRDAGTEALLDMLRKIRVGYCGS